MNCICFNFSQFYFNCSMTISENCLTINICFCTNVRCTLVQCSVHYMYLWIPIIYIDNRDIYSSYCFSCEISCSNSNLNKYMNRIFYVSKFVCLFGCLFVCMSDQNWRTPEPICLKIWLGNSGEPQECSQLCFEIIRWVGSVG